MSIELIMLGGYGQFVWPAFIFTLISLYTLYVKAKKGLVKQEKIYLRENKQVQTIQIKAVRDKKTIQEVLSENSI